MSKIIEDTQAEECIIGAILEAGEDVRCEILESVKAQHFNSPARRTIFNKLVDMVVGKTLINFMELTQALLLDEELERVGGAAKITEYGTQYSMTCANWKHYYERLENHRYLRSLKEVAAEISAIAEDVGRPVGEIKEEVERRVLALDLELGEDVHTAGARQLAVEAIAAIEQRITRKTINGCATGLRDIDMILDGLKPGEMSVVAARPSVGKSAMLMQIAEHAAIDEGHAVLFFSAEMSRGMLIERQVASRARISLDKRNREALTQEDMLNLNTAASDLAKSPIYVNDKPGMNIGYISAVSRRINRKTPLKIIFVDYMQMIRSTSKRANDNRRNEVDDVSAGLKQLAKELKLHVCVAAQLNRDAEKGKDNKPRMSNLKESSQIEQDADVIVLLHAKDDVDNNFPTREVEIKIEKNRNGATDGWKKFLFMKQYTRFVPHVNA